MNLREALKLFITLFFLESILPAIGFILNPQQDPLALLILFLQASIAFASTLIFQRMHLPIRSGGEIAIGFVIGAVFFPLCYLFLTLL